MCWKERHWPGQQTHYCVEISQVSGRNVFSRNEGLSCAKAFLTSCMSSNESFVLFLRWMINMQNRKQQDPRSVFGRMKRSGIVGTLLTEAHASVGYPVVHPFQDRYITIREAARIQVDAFPCRKSSERCHSDGRDFRIAISFWQQRTEVQLAKTRLRTLHPDSDRSAIQSLLLLHLCLV